MWKRIVRLVPAKCPRLTVLGMRYPASSSADGQRPTCSQHARRPTRPAPPPRRPAARGCLGGPCRRAAPQSTARSCNPAEGSSARSKRARRESPPQQRGHASGKRQGWRSKGEREVRDLARRAAGASGAAEGTGGTEGERSARAPRRSGAAVPRPAPLRIPPASVSG